MDDDSPNNNSFNEKDPGQPEPIVTEETETSVSEVISSTPEPNTPPTPMMDQSSSSGGDIVFTDKPKKSKAGLVIGIICGLLILGGAGTFIAIYAINNQPENILMSSFEKFVNAKQISTTGTIDLDLDGDTTGIDKATLTLGLDQGSSSEAGNLSLAITMADGTEVNSLSIGESMMSDGTLYLKFDGLEDFYQNFLSRYLSSYAMAGEVDSIKADKANTVSLNSGNLATSSTRTLVESNRTLVETNDVLVEPRITTGSLGSYFAEIASQLDGEWFEISLSDILSSDYFSSMSNSEKNQIENGYNCVVDMFKNNQKYAKELTDIYNKNKFITMYSGEDSYYNIGITDTPFIAFLEATAKTSLISDLTTCTNSVVTSDIEVDTDAVEDFLGQLPSISAKFDGFINHELSALKISSKNTGLSLEANLKFTYPNNLNISAPENATPIMERVDAIVSQLQSQS